MPLVGAAAITAGGAIAGGVIASKASKRAAAAQQKATQDALAYERENQSSRQSRYDAAMQDYQKRYDAWLKQFYGVDAPASGGGGVHSSSAGGAAPIGPSAVSPYQAVAPHQNGNSIAQLLLQMGQQQGDAANASADIWGNVAGQVGSGLGTALKANYKPKPKVTLAGAFQPTGVTPAEAGISPYEAAPMPEPSGGWNDWRNYIGTGVQ